MLKTTAIVVGAGHCGLAMSRCLAGRSIDHVVLERGEVAHSWRTQRWDSLRLLTPSWMTRLPGYAYRGDDPDGYLAAPDVVELIERYAKESAAPVRANTTVTSVRKDERRYWMSASGVDKSDLREVGKDVLMVKDYEADTGTMVLSVPPGIEPNRVSVDAIEHWMIYQEHPEVNAIVHVHAWIPGIPATEFNYPCGTAELAVAVADIIRDEHDPSHAVVGLKNHGITVTGTSLEDIFERIEPVIEVQVPMIA